MVEDVSFMKQSVTEKKDDFISMDLISKRESDQTKNESTSKKDLAFVDSSKNESMVLESVNGSYHDSKK